VRIVRPLLRDTWLMLTIRVRGDSCALISSMSEVPAVRSISRMTIPNRSRSTYQGMTLAGCSTFEMITSSPGCQFRLQATMEMPSEVLCVSATSSAPAPKTRPSCARRSGSIVAMSVA